MENENRNIEEEIRNLCDPTSGRMDRRILNDLFGRLKQPETIAPASSPVRMWRMIMDSKRTKLAAAAVIAAGILLPVSYGAVKAVTKYLTVSSTSHVTFEYPDQNTTYTVARSVSVTMDDANSPEEAKARLKEFRELYLAGKVVEIKPGVWEATLSDGTSFAFGGDPATAGMDSEFTEEEKAQLKKQFDEINELKKAGKGERTFWKEVEENGVRTRLYHVRYTLSDGKAVTLCEGEAASKP